ncbi:PEP-CTERM sorting domain-containing protein [Candidatus Accumulibacter sp. ACC005]|uniref:PEP-CTERM sorting domain-containing protein n=2 Tax=unclassified Candidatus Accumulibacter TaxID=2619054 RepID=UPI0025C36271|nr:PEP-CTERM sorting domain-containing protein [Candidatus Accumulibacter sp. ACC005]
MKKRLAAAALCAAFAAAPTHAAVTWSFDYLDAVGVGFNDIAAGAARRGELQSAANYVSTFLTSYTANIFMSVDGSGNTPGNLASASSNFNASRPANGFNDRGDVMLKILGGDAADPAVGTADGTVKWNFATNDWALGNTFQPGEYDFFSTAVHELVHALGFAAGIAENGNDGFGDVPGTAGVWSPFSQFLTSYNGTPFIDQTTYILDKVIYDQARLSADGNGLSGCGAGTLFNGPNAVAANGGVAPQIYAPTTWEDGSSGSHLDDNCYTAPNTVSTYMMEAQTISGLGVRTITALEVGMMRDIGYTQFGVQTQPPGGTVPEPSSVLLLLGSLGLLGAARRRKAA